MKKKKKVNWKIIVLVILLVLSLIPMHVYMSDGGSEGWYAILYQVTDVHELYQDGFNIGTRVTVLGFIPIYDDVKYVPGYNG